ncbi:MAG: hypothetical protein P9L99_08750, partial [Candidatus Lernaella stagnicola]|nr:hypothetical protein [Candidatus Lernaella stagnicola]
LNDESLLHFALDGGGAPDFSVDLMTFETERSLVAAAGSVSLGVAVIQSTGHDVFATAFNSTNGETALWTYDFDEGFTLLSGALDVAADGSVVVAGARDPVAETTLLVVLDGATGVELRRLEQAANISTVELSDDGARAVFTEGATASVVDITNLSMLFSFAVSGSGGRHGISRDGNAVAAGGFDAAAYVETAKGWELAWSEAEATQWYGNGLALSGDGETLFAVSRNYSNNLDLTYRVIDLVSGAELARATTNGTGSFQDSPWRARVSADGAVLAIASWGLENNAHPEVQIFDRAATVIGGVDMPGSPFDLDLSADGRYLLVGGKAVHANDMGSGGDVFLCDIEAFPTRNR